jgi:hypothetical protein
MLNYQRVIIGMTGWWYTYPSEKYEFVSWDHSSQYMEKNKNVPNHQPDDYGIYSPVSSNMAGKSPQ